MQLTWYVLQDGSGLVDVLQVEIKVRARMDWVLRSLIAYMVDVFKVRENVLS